MSLSKLTLGSKILTAMLQIDDNLDFEGEPPNIESWFPSNLSETATGPKFWTISDDDFEPDTTLSQQDPPPEMDPPVYDEHGEGAAQDVGSDEPTPEEIEYLKFLENLKNSVFIICHLSCV